MYNPQMTFDRIREIRESQNIALAQLNEACNIGENTIATSAKSKNGLSAKAIYDISAYLGVSADELLERTPTVSNGNITGNNSGNANNTNCNFGSAPQDVPEEALEIAEMLRSLSFRDRAELMGIISDYYDTHKKG